MDPTRQLDLPLFPRNRKVKSVAHLVLVISRGLGESFRS